MSSISEIYACLCVKHFPAQAILRLRRDLKDKPCVVLAGIPPQEQVCAVNTKARLLGIKVDMTRVEIETYPTVVALPQLPAMEQAAKAALLECAGTFSPRVEYRCTATEFLCGIDISGTEALFGSSTQLAKALIGRARALGFSVHVTVSYNFSAAESMALGLSQKALHVIPSSGEAAALAPLPLHVLPLTAAQFETLSGWGIRTLGMLGNLPEEQLIARLGQDGKDLRQRARGEARHLFRPVVAAPQLKESFELDSPVESLDSLLFVVGVMVDQLILRANAQLVSLASLMINLQLDDGATHVRKVSPALPTCSRQLWLKLLHLDLQANPPHASIVGIDLHGEPGETSKVQLGLFSPQVPEPSRLDVTLARLRSIVGETNAGRAVLTDTNSCNNYRIEPFTIKPATTNKTLPQLHRTAIRQIRPPEAIRLITEGATPARFIFRSQRYKVTSAYGPWRTSGQWWADKLWSAEQWDLIAHGFEMTLCCCVLHDLLSDTWLMTALYD